MKFLKDIKNIKARILLNQNIDDNEIFSIAINAKNRSDQRSFDEAMKLLSKPLSKQSNILLLELFRISINENDSKLAHRLLKTLLRKTNQSFVIHTVLNSKNYILRTKLIESIKENKKLKTNNKIYLFFMLWQMKKIPKRFLFQNIKCDLDKLLLEYQFNLNRVDWGYDSVNKYAHELESKHFLLRLMNLTIFLTKIGYTKKAISYFKRGFGLLKTSHPTTYQDYFKSNLQGWGSFNKEKRFNEGICDFDGITKYLDTDFKTFFNTPFNQSELEISRLKTTNALNFATEFAEFSNDTNILEIIFPIHLSNGFFHTDTFGYLSLIERVNKNGFDKNWADRINNYFFNNQQYSSKIAFLGLSKEIRQKNNINENKIKDLFTNKVLRGRLRGLFYYSSYENKIEYCGGCSNSIAFKFVYEKADKEIKDWLEDLFIAKKLTDSNREFLESNLDTQKVINFKKMFSKEIGDNFYTNIKEKIRRLSHQGILTETNLLNEMSINSACFLLRDARNSKDFKKAMSFLKQIKLYSGKKVYYRNKLRKDFILEKGKKDYLSSKKFRAEMSKFFQAFLELKLKDQRKFFPNSVRSLISFILPYCDRKTFAKYLRQDPYGLFRSLRSQTVLESVRIKKGLERMRSLSDKDFDKDYRKYVSNIIKKDYFGGDEISKIIYFLEEAKRRYSKADFENKLVDDLNQIPCKARKLEVIHRILGGDTIFNSGKKPNQAVTSSLDDLKNKFIENIKEMSIGELEKTFDNEAIRNLFRYCDALNGFLLEKIPYKVIHRLIDDYNIFQNHANPQTLHDGLKRPVVKNAIRHACIDLSITNTFHFNNSWFANSIFRKFGSDSMLDNFRHWDKECLQIIEESVAPIYQNMANVSLNGLKSLNFKNKKQAESFAKCIERVISIERDLETVKYFRKRHIKIYDAIEAAAGKLLKKDKIGKLTGNAFLKLIDYLFRFEQDAAKAYLSKSKFKQFKKVLKNCALHIIKINQIDVSTNKSLYLSDSELKLEIMKNYLQSMDTFDPKYQITLNNLPLSRDIVQYSRKYHAPYWANSLNLYS